MTIERDGERRRDATRWFDELVAGEFGFASWFEEESPEGATGDAVDGAHVQGVRSVWRGEEDRPSARWAEVRLAAFDEPGAGKGTVSAVRLHLVEGPGAPGQATVTFAVHRPDDDGPTDLGWQGPASGRLLVGTGSIDFRARDGSCLTRREGGSVLELVLGEDWTDRDETPGEMLAALRGVLVMREA